MAFGNTRPLVPTKVGWPSFSLKARRSAGEKSAIACCRRGAAAP